MNRGTDLLLALAIAGIGAARAQEPAPAAQTPPVRIETAYYANSVDRGYGLWQGGYTQLWLRSSTRFIPAFTVERQSRPAGVQQNYAFFSYLNWTPNLYTTQAVSAAPQPNQDAIYFPKLRYDVDLHWKVPPGRQLVLQGGYTHFDFGPPGRGQIFHGGVLWYRRSLVLESNLFVNRSQPGSLWSASGSVAAQYGREGSYWLGATAGGGRELYRFVGKAPADLSYQSYSIDIFYRRWITRHVGFVVAADYHDKLGAYRWVGVRNSMFFEF